MTFSTMRNYLVGMGCFVLQKMIGLCVLTLGNHSCSNVGGKHGSCDASSGKKIVASDDQSVGGQAVIEGVMMRSPRSIATAVRKPDTEIFIKHDPYVALSKRHKLLNIPIFRGALSFFEMLVIGLKALNFSADIALEETEKTEKVIISGTDDV